VAQAIHNKEAFKRAEKELARVRNIPGCRLLNWTEPEYPQTLLQIYDPPVLFYLRGDPQILNMPCLSIVGTRRPMLYGSQMAEGWAATWGRARAGNPQRHGAGY
jgi:predicted Rossmann fold nucleotide-binding protein DprA/Smf involved in DNA uptake